MLESTTSEALSLSEDLLADLELSRTSLTNSFMKACRLARLIGDADQLQIFQYELSGYPSSPDGVPRDVWRLCVLSGRVSQKKDAKTDKISETADIKSVEELEEGILTNRTRLEFSRPQPVNISSANPNQYVHAPARNIPVENQIAESLRKATRAVAARRSYLYSYCLNRSFELRVSSASGSIFDLYRQRIDAALGSLIPSELKSLDSIDANINSENSENWASAVHSCRRLLQEVADAVYPSEVGGTVEVNGKKIKIGPDNYINRLVLFFDQSSKSGVYSSIVGSELRFIGDRLDAAFSASQKGSHSTVSLEEARRYIIHTYLAVGDVVDIFEDAKGQPSQTS